MSSLYEAQWRQGCIISASLSARVYTVKEGGLSQRDIEHDLWLLAEQDCDLEQTPDDDGEKFFELRAVRPHSGNVPSSISGNIVRIDDAVCLHAMDLVVKVTAQWLSFNADRRVVVSDQRRREVKTWLGYRYDRPAVPKRFVEAHSRIKELAKQKRAKPETGKSEKNWLRVDLKKVRDIMVAYDAPRESGKAFAFITAIVKESVDIAEIQEWMERVRDAVEDDESLIVATVDTVDTDGAPISLLERAFSIYGDTHSLETAT